MIAAARAALLAAGLATGAAATRAPAAAAAHDVHVSHTRAVVEGTTIVARVRMFTEDLGPALAAANGGRAVPMVHAPASDSAVQRYLATRLVFKADGVALAGTVTDAGVEQDAGGQGVYWVVLTYAAAKPIGRLGVTDAILRERFREQQNLVALMRMPGERRSSLYFVDDKEQVVP